MGSCNGEACEECTRRCLVIHQGRTLMAPRNGPIMNYTLDEDVALCQAYVAIINNSQVGASQTGDCFWKRVLDKFINIYGNPNGRNQKGVNNRFSTIKKEVLNYVNIVKALRRIHPCGWTEHDYAYHGRIEYQARAQRAFAHEHAFLILKVLPIFDPHCFPLPRVNQQPQAGDQNLPNTPADPTCRFTVFSHHIPKSQPNQPILDTHASGSGTARPVATNTTKRTKRCRVTHESFQSMMSRDNEFINKYRGSISSRSAEIGIGHSRIEDPVSTKDRSTAFKDALITLKERQEENRILSMTISHLTPLQVEYWRAEKRRLIEKRQAEDGRDFTDYTMD